MASIFISYRRVGALVHARALFERLRHEFGPNEVFIDLEGVDYGLDFIDILNEQLNGCQVMLAVIDPQWATATDRQGRRRIDREFDYVRVEIVTALGRGIRTVPVLIDGAEMPDASDLPEPLRPLTRRNALMLDFNRFDAEISRLIAVIRKLLSAPNIDRHLEAAFPKPPVPELPEIETPSTQGDAKAKQKPGQSQMSGAARQAADPAPPEPPKPVLLSASVSAAGPTDPAAMRRRTFIRWTAILAITILLGAVLLFIVVGKPGRNVPTPAPQGLVKSMEQALIVGQYFGEPLILSTLRVESTSMSTTNITDIRGTLTGKDRSFIVAPLAWTIVNSYGPFVPIAGPIPIFPGAKLDLRVVMITGANFTELYSKTAALPEYKSQLPCVIKPNGAPDPMTPAAFNLAKAFAEEHFGWSAGDWKLRVDVTTDNASTSFTRSFSLSPSEIDKLRSSIVLIKQCLTVAQTSPLAQDGTISNFLSK
jgi:hypothetical protein